MKSRASLLNGALIAENFRRMWPVMLAGIVMWLIFVPFAIIIGGESGGYGYYVFEQTLRHINPASVLMDLIMPVSLAVASFAYMHRSNSTGVMHAMPFSRRSLFVSSYVGGLAMSLVPMLTGAASLLLMQDRIRMLPETVDAVRVEISALSIGRFCWQEFVVISFVYSVSVLAAMVTGNSVIHALTAVAFNFLVPVLYLLGLGYMNITMYGFSDDSLVRSVLSKLSPYIWMMFSASQENKFLPFVYLLITLAVIALAMLAYRLRPLERTGDSYIFKPVKYVIGFLIAFIFSSLTYLAFYDSFGFPSLALGFAFGYIVGQMIVFKTTKIFSAECLASGLVYAVVIAAVAACFHMDVFGYEKRVPQSSSVEYVFIESSYMSRDPYIAGHEYKDPKNVESISSFHRSLIDRMDEYDMRDTGYDFGEESTWVSLQYVMKDGRTMSRQYIVPQTAVRESAYIKSVWESGENRDTSLLDAIDPSETVIDLYCSAPENASDKPSDYNRTLGMHEMAKEKELIIAALKEDLGGAVSYESMFGPGAEIYGAYANVNIDSRRKLAPGETDEDSKNSNFWYYYDYDAHGEPTYRHTVINVYINEYYVNTLEAFEKLGMPDPFEGGAESLN